MPCIACGRASGIYKLILGVDAVQKGDTIGMSGNGEEDSSDIARRRRKRQVVLAASRAKNHLIKAKRV